ncbi:MAG: hypothetical protein VX899_22965 [Myxococcota bacterium]|nr:hypothetical protein [Myxococcota bacterium]
MTEHEAALWSLLHRVETHTAARYAAQAPALLTDDKREAAARIAALVPSQDVLAGTELAEVLPPLLGAAEGQGGPHDALWIQGLLLELLGVTLYRALQQGGRLSAEGEAAASFALQASSTTAALAAAQISALGFTVEDNFALFTGRSEPVLQQLDHLGEALDARFGGPLDLLFSDVMGDYVAELLPVCGELGFGRRQVMVHLTSAMMG